MKHYPHLPYEMWALAMKQGGDKPDITTNMLCKKLGIGRSTLERWISTGVLKAPKIPQKLKKMGMTYRLWSDEDVARVQEVKRNMKMGRPAKKHKSKTKRRKK